MGKKLKSRKFWTAVVAGALVIANDGLELGLDKETVMGFAGIIMTYIFGQSVADAAQAKGGAK